MVKTAAGADRRGLNDWMIQRFTAVYMLFCTVALVIFFATHPSLSFPEWHELFQGMIIRVMTVLFVLSLLWHAWIGIWTVLTDYLHCGIARNLINLIVLFVLAGFFVTTLFILWSV